MQTHQRITEEQPATVDANGEIGQSLLQDRERIARGLHDTVLSELTGIVLAMQRARHFLPSAEQSSFDEALTGVDSLLRSFRGTVHNLKQSTTLSLRDQLTQLVSHFDALLPQQLSLATSAILPTLDADAQNDLISVLTEALTNAAKYSNAAYVDVDLTWESGKLTLMITDDGVGISEDAAGSAGPLGGNGMRSMAHRATQHGGEFEVGPGYRRGTVIRWTIPVTSQPEPTRVPGAQSGRH